MCGIACCWGNYSLERMHAAIDKIRHRGPDGNGFYSEDDFKLQIAHTRLAIIDLSESGRQPMTDSSGLVTIVFNGEIYNFLTLRKQLQLDGVQFKGASDTEVLLHMYLQRGVDCLHELTGIFAFAIWDRRDETLFVARDNIGVKPLYYAETATGFAVCSEIKGLLSIDPELSSFDQLDIHSIQRYLTFLWCPGEGTPLKNVRKLGPGEAMIVKDRHVQRKWCWYRLPILAKQQPITDVNMAIHMVRSELQRAVTSQMISDVPLGAFLSGGLDSSSVVAFARDQNPGIHCFTIELIGAEDEGITDDLPYARRVAAHLRVPLEVVRIDATRMAVDLPAMVEQLDEPLADPAALNVLYICRLAREQGLKVLLSGTGGDDLFTGYRRHRALMNEGLWSWLPKPARAGLEHLTRGLDQNQPTLRRIRKLFNGAALAGDSRLVNYFRWIDRCDLVALYTPEFRATLVDASAEDPMLAFLSELPSQTSRLERLLALEQRFFLTDHNLNYTDKMSMAASVEVRVPFLDPDLVALTARIPDKFKQRGGEGKWVLKKAMEPYLPRNVIYRAKTGFGAPLRRWMRFELRDLVSDALGDASLRNRGLFDSAAVQRLVAANDGGKVDASYTLFALICIELWCRRFIDAATQIELP